MSDDEPNIAFRRGDLSDSARKNAAAFLRSSGYDPEKQGKGNGWSVAAREAFEAHFGGGTSRADQEVVRLFRRIRRLDEGNRTEIEIAVSRVAAALIADPAAAPVVLGLADYVRRGAARQRQRARRPPPEPR